MTKLDPELCLVDDALDVLVGKWKPAILLRLLDGDAIRFGQLRRSIPDVTQKMLTKQLRELEDDGLVERIVYAEVPPKVEYAITEYGMSLKPILMNMHQWAAAHKRRKLDSANETDDRPDTVT